MNDAERERARLQELVSTLPPKLPDVPNFLLELARNQKKLAEVRKNRASDREMSEVEKKYQGMMLESFKKGLVEVDTLHKKAVIELKAIDGKLEKLEAFSEGK